MHPYNNQWVHPSPSSYQEMQPRHQQMGHTHHFNPNARAFVPRSYNVAPHMHNQQMYNQQFEFQPSYVNTSMHSNMQQQQYHQSYDYNAQPPAMADYGPDGDLGYEHFGFAQQQQYIASTDLQQQHRNSKNFKELQEILVGLEQLLPGGEDFNSWAVCIRDRLRSKEMTVEGKKLSIQTAVEMATTVVNPSIYSSHTDFQPQYTMARLLSYLSSEIPGLLQSAILPSLEEAYKNQPKANPEQKANLLMFFAELYTSLESEVAGNKLSLLAEPIINQIKDFLLPSNVNNEGMKLLIQVLKLAGRDLDLVPSIKENMNILLSTLMGYSNGHPKLSETIKAQIKDLLEQRNKGWGPSSYKQTSTSVYCADGSLLELNDDECKFLEECLEAGESSSATNDPSDTSLDEADVMSEFDSFMKEEALMERTMNMIDDISLSEETARQKTPEAPISTTPTGDSESTEKSS